MACCGLADGAGIETIEQVDQGHIEVLNVWDDVVDWVIIYI